MKDHSVFASPDFDPNQYANAVLAGEPYPPLSQQPGKPATKAPDPPAKEDISFAISKLNFEIDDVSKEIKTLVSTYHEELLSQAANASNLSGSVTSVRAGLNDLDGSLEKLRLKVRVPYQSLQAHVSHLQRLQQASDVLRRMSRFVVLARRLEAQMLEMEGNTDGQGSQDGRSDTPLQGATARGSTRDAMQSTVGEHEDEKERTIAKAALSIAELVALLDGPKDQHSDGQNGVIDKAQVREGYSEDATISIPLRSINAVATHVPFIDEARAKVTAEMESMVWTGLTTLNQSLLASSLQTAYNLGVLPDLTNNLLSDLSKAVEERIRATFDLTKISKDALGSKDSASAVQSQTSSSSPVYKSRIRTEPTNFTAPQWTVALWARLETLTEEMAACCIKVYTLEKVLKLKKDAVSQTLFLDEAMKVLENKPSVTFWTSVGSSLEKHSRDSARNSTFLQQTLSTSYPRLLRLFHEFFAKIAVHTDTVYTQTYQSPETVLVLRALSNFESVYLTRSTTRLNEVVSQAFSSGARAPPGMNDGVNIARIVANELDSARFDPLLVKNVARNVVGCLDSMLRRVDGLAVKDRSAVVLQGPSATPQQVVNGQLASCLYHGWSRLQNLKDEHTEAVFAILSPSIQNIHKAYDRIVDPLLTAIRRELGAIIAWLHRIDFAKSQSADPMSGMGGGPSVYMKDLVEKLAFVKGEVLSNFAVGEDEKEWLTSIVRYVVRTFVLHVSIAKPLGEGGKLQLTSDMAELEFALSAFMVEASQSKRGGNLEGLGDDYRALRAMRPLLFLDNEQLASAKHTAGLPPLIVLHHILVRSPIPLPHRLHGWQEAEYVRWVDEHSEEEAWTLIDSGLVHWEKMKESEGAMENGAGEYVRLARSVLGQLEDARRGI